ncbi:MAG TPA: hypothetical protein VFA27_13235 [Vicinamibacterales bacterium]|nr:hypothetical protein [Vicinamibacterales bacterium]
MPDFNVRADSVNVEQIMEQIRARIREKRGVDYTEAQIRELAAVKLERFLDPSGIRSDLLEQFRKVQPPYSPPELPNYAFEDSTLYESHRGPLRLIRKLLNPLLKLFFNPNPLIQALHIQARLNTMSAEREATREAARRASDQLFYELIHNLVIETTRMSIEVKNLKMRVESIGSRLEFNERRARALESAVVYKSEESPSPAADSRPPRPHAPAPPQAASHVESRPSAATPAERPSEAAPRGDQAPQAAAPGGEGPGQRSRRRRRRRGRRGRGPAAAVMGGQAPQTDESVAHGDDQADSLSDRESDAPAHDDLETISGADAHPTEPPPDPESHEG